MLSVVLLTVNILQIVRYHRLERGFNQLYELSASYRSYIAKNFLADNIHSDYLTPVIKDLCSAYAQDVEITYIAYVSQNICGTCLSNLYVDLKDFKVNIHSVLFVSGIHDIQLKREAASYGFDNFIFDNSEIFQHINTSDIIVFKSNAFMHGMNYMKYDDTSSVALKLFID